MVQLTPVSYLENEESLVIPDTSPHTVGWRTRGEPEENQRRTRGEPEKNPHSQWVGLIDECESRPIVGVVSILAGNPK